MLKYSLSGSLWKWADFLIHKALRQHRKFVCVFIDFFLFSQRLRDTVFVEDVSFYWLQLYNIIIAIINLPQISKRTLIKNILLCCKNLPKLKTQWKTGVLLLHITMGQKGNPRTETSKRKHKNSLQVILLVCRNNYGKEDTILSFINKLSVIYFCFLLFSKWLNHNFIFFTAYVKDYTHVSN